MRYIATVILIFVGLATQAQQQIIDKVVATIGSELVLLSEVEEQHALSLAQRGTLPEDARCRIVEQLMANKLLINQAVLDSVEVSEDEVETQLDARIEQILSYMNGDIEQFETYYGQSIGAVKEQFRRDLRNQLLSERMRSQIMADVKVTPSEVKSFYSSITVDSLPYFSSEVEISEIVMRPKTNEAERNKMITKLEDIKAQIENGTSDFPSMAQKFSEDGSARLGGDLGWASRGKFVPEFEAAAYKLKDNEISDVVTTEFGFHLIQMLGRRGNAINVRHILLRPRPSDNDLELAERKLDSIRTLIMDDSISFSVAVKTYSFEDIQSYNNDGRMVNSVTGNTFFEVGDLDPDVYFTIDTMEVGSMSKPFRFRQQDEYFFRLVRLESRTQPHTANLAADYSKIQKAAIESKRNEFINNWIENRIDDTFIQVDTRYNGCLNLDLWRKAREIRP
ncbi:MAG: peptidylprolyl isomerase [Saprospiraceae bacterium]|nr:peptidylprolyl isomerase [Saprospiraceae bacterium]